MSRRSAAAFCVVFSCTEYRLSALPFTASNSTTATEPSAAVITITTPKLAYSFLRTDRFRRRFLMAGLSRRRWGEAGRTARVIATARRQLRGRAADYPDPRGRLRRIGGRTSQERHRHNVLPCGDATGVR